MTTAMSVAPKRFQMLAARGGAGVYLLYALATRFLPLCGYRRFGLWLQSLPANRSDADYEITATRRRRSAVPATSPRRQFLQKQTVPTANAAGSAA